MVLSLPRAFPNLERENRRLDVSTIEIENKNKSNFKHKPDQLLHRITPFHRFKEIVLDQKLTLVSCAKWTDPHEGPLAKRLMTIDGACEIEAHLEKRGLLMFPMLSIEMLRRYTYMQCWTAAEEKPRMWEEYSPDCDGVRFATTLQKIYNICHLHVYEVEYVDTLDFETEAEKIFSRASGVPVITMTQVFRRKHRQYDYEEEVRIMYNMTGFESNDESGLKKLDLSHIPNFIEGAIVDPRASDELVEEVRIFCEENSIAFHGRSSLCMTPASD